MATVATFVAAAWCLLFATAILARQFVRSRIRAVIAVLVCAAALDGAALAWLGFGRNGLLGAAGMALPCAVAIGLAIVSPPRS